MAHVRSSNRRIIRKKANPLFLILIFLVAKQPLFSEELIQFNFNNVELKSALQTLIIDHNIAIHHSAMEQAEDVHTLYKAQGSISALRRLKYLREEMNKDG